MPLLVYQPRNYDQTHEREEFRNLCELLKNRYYSSPDEMCIMIGNYNIGDVELDALIIKDDGIVLVEFKDYGGRIIATENGDWTSEERGQLSVVRGGAGRKNPYTQAKINRASCKPVLVETDAFQPIQVERMVSLVVFHRSATIDNRISPRIKWLRLCDEQSFVDEIDLIVSPGCDLQKNDYKRIIDRLALNKDWLCVRYSNVEVLEIDDNDYSPVKLNVNTTQSKPKFNMDSGKKQNWPEFKAILDRYGIKKLFHFTDRDNLESIIQNGGLYSWEDCKQKGISIPRPGGGDLSRQLDARDGLGSFVRISFTQSHPMMFSAMNDGRISNPVILEIDPEVIFLNDTLFSDRNATKNGASVGSDIDAFRSIHFNSVLASSVFDLDSSEQEFYQAEVLVKSFIPLKYITNISNFGITINQAKAQYQAKEPYTAQISRSNPTAFIFLVDHSCSMTSKTTLHGEEMTLAEAVARIVNNQINELVLRCIKTNEVRHYYDIAVIGYGHDVYSAWNGELAGRGFVSPEELRDHPYKKIVTREEVRTRKGTTIKEIEKVQWLEANTSGSWTHAHKALKKAMEMLNEWMASHHDQDCYPPTIINITDGEFNGCSSDEVLQLANELKAMHTNDGNVLLWNIHITSGHTECISLPANKDELKGNRYSETLYSLSSLLPTKYNAMISRLRNTDDKTRYTAMSVNADMSTLIQLMDIGTPTNINSNKD